MCHPSFDVLEIALKYWKPDGVHVLSKIQMHMFLESGLAKICMDWIAIT